MLENVKQGVKSGPQLNIMSVGFVRLISKHRQCNF
jgi:hypothetical protein